MADSDDTFIERADEHIFLSNDQIAKGVSAGKVSASNMYATARFNVWLSASGCESGEELAEGKTEITEYFVAEYKKMLEENLDNYCKNFDDYMKGTSGK
tara:strand:+ start:231 stop:527 length:297 start_codon:yes stop_codon:yes gene_type:complete